MKSARNSIGVTAFFALFFPLVLFAQSADEIKSQIATHQSQLDSLNKEIAAYEQQLTTIGSKKQTLQGAINSLDISYKQTQAKIKAIQNKIATTELEITALTGSISNKESSIALDTAAVGESIRSLQESDSASLAEMVFSNQSLSGMWDDAENAIAFQENLHSHVEALQAAKVELTDNKKEQEAKQAELVRQKGDLTSEQQSLAVQKKAQQELLTQTKSQESNYQSLLKQKQASKVVFEQSLNELESKLQYTLDPSRLPPSGKGILHWPLDTIRITQQFGKTADSGRLYSSGTHNGVDFAASIGTPVKAVLSGIITATGNTDAIYGCYSYGKWVLIKHNNGLSTLYGHLSQINASQGESVSTGETIGYSGATGYATGPHLHLSLYASDAVQVRQLSSGKGCNNAVMPVSAPSGYLDPLQYL